MQAIGVYSARFQQIVEESRSRYQRERDLHPTVACLGCMDSGEIRFGSRTIANERGGTQEVRPGYIPCPYCEKGKDKEKQHEREQWLERVNAECGIPREIRLDVDRSRFDHEIKRAIQDSIHGGVGAYLYGGVGRGKSVAAAGALLEFVRSAGDVRERPGRYGYFTTTSDYLQSIRETYDSGGVGQPSRKYRTDPLGADRARLLVLDDVGREYVKSNNGDSWALEQIGDLIDHRVTQGLPTIFTSNLTLDQLEKKYNRASYPMGSRIASRIAGSCEAIRVDGPDYRRKAA